MIELFLAVLRRLRTRRPQRTRQGAEEGRLCIMAAILAAGTLAGDHTWNSDREMAEGAVSAAREIIKAVNEDDGD